MHERAQHERPDSQHVHDSIFDIFFPHVASGHSFFKMIAGVRSHQFVKNRLNASGLFAMLIRRTETFYHADEQSMVLA
jgi:hypothetical protein